MILQKKQAKACCLALSKYKMPTVFTGIFLVIFYVIAMLGMKNGLEKNITIGVDDEVHTINMGIESIGFGKVQTLRVGESSRWFARAIYPFAQYYMNTKMGGEHYLTGWDYPGGFYLKKYHTDTNIERDPNRQDFVFAMRLLLNTALIGSFMLASWLMIKRYGWTSGLVYSIGSLTSHIVTNNYNIFYHETVAIIVFNSIVAMALIFRGNSYRFILWMVFLFTLSLFTKLSGAILIIPIAVAFITRKPSIMSGLRLEASVLMFFVSCWLINMHAIGWRELIDQYLSNVYHFKTGHLRTYPSGMYQLTLIAKQIWPILFCIPLALFSLYIRPSANKAFTVSVLIAALICLASLVDVNIFIARNLALPYVMLIYVISVSASIFDEGFFNRKGGGFVNAVACVFMVIYLIRLVSIDHDDMHGLIMKDISSLSCSKPATDYSSRSFFQGVGLVADMPDEFEMKSQLDSIRERFYGYDCVFIRRNGNNKHYTNFILPIDYDIIARRGDFFVYKHKAGL